MSKAQRLQAKAAALPEELAAEVLDFLEFVSLRHSKEGEPSREAITRIRGAFKGRLSSSDEFANRKSDEIVLEE